jgi:4-fold beta flower protein
LLSMIDTIIYDIKGDPVAYITAQFRPTIFLWSGTPVAYLHEEQYVYGINGYHLGWFRNEILFNNDGERIGFTFSTCPVAISKEPVKGKKQSMVKPRPRCRAKSLPKFLFRFADKTLAEFLAEGQISPTSEGSQAEESLD